MKNNKTKTLTKTEFLELELQHAQSDLVNREKVILDLKKQLIKANKSILVYMNKELDQDLGSLEQAAETLAQKREKSKKTRELSMAKVRKRLKLADRFGYNPDTLEVQEG